ncbi:MAG: hypothetical protein IJK19_01550 [Bacteroidales bacterium]|nr:hypothetical protein [Bacteroidales bacterium]
MNNEFWIEVILPICICVVLPVLIVFIVGRVRQNETNRKTEVMLKAIENGTPIDPDYFKSSRPKKQRSIKERLLDRLTGASVTGLIGVAALVYGIWKGNLSGWDEGDRILILIAAVLIAIGIANLVFFIIGKKMLAKEIEEEEKQNLIKQD